MAEYIKSETNIKILCNSVYDSHNKTKKNYILFLFFNKFIIQNTLFIEFKNKK